MIIKLGGKQISAYWLFLAVCLVSSVVAVYALRQNNKTMIELREAVYQADKYNGDVETALNNLREYVHAHMNTNLSSGGNAIKPPIQLKYTYERLVTAEQERVDKINSGLYTKAQEYCQTQNPSGFSGRGRVPCVEQYVTANGESTQPIPTSLYKFDFVSPLWSPDLAGWSLVLAVLSFLIFIGLVAVEKLVRSNISNRDI